jgi:hypothetical protein
MASLTQPRLEGDNEALCFFLQAIVGGVVMGVTGQIIHDPLGGEIAGFVAMWLAIFPLARRTWAHGVSVRHYARMVALATTFGTAFRIITS